MYKLVEKIEKCYNKKKVKEPIVVTLYSDTDLTFEGKRKLQNAIEKATGSSIYNVTDLTVPLKDIDISYDDHNKTVTEKWTWE